MRDNWPSERIVFFLLFVSYELALNLERQLLKIRSLEYINYVLLKPEYMKAHWTWQYI